MPRPSKKVNKDKDDDLSVVSDSDNEKIQKSAKLVKTAESKKSGTKKVEAKTVAKKKSNQKLIEENEENENSDEDIEEGIEELRKAQKKRKHWRNDSR